MAWPNTFGPYRQVSHLGSGAFGHTFRVEDESHNFFALKWLRENPEANGKKRFENESWALGHLDHPCIPAYVSSGVHDDRPFIVMSLAEGVSLENIFEQQRQEQGPITQLKMLNIAEGVLAALAHGQDRGIFHRDVKLANIMATSNLRKVTLVDFGVCKGKGQPVDAATFWNAGASRTSPPEKLRHPTFVHPAHDSFSVGVIAYALLTNEYPWSVGEHEDRGHLEEQMRNVSPLPICNVNPSVKEAVSDFFMSLLIVDDAKRPQPKQAHTRCTALIEEFQSNATRPQKQTRAAGQFSHVIRDPVHGDIPVTNYEWKLIGTHEFQRLRWIRQLGAANLVYPGADHSRFSHVIGTMHVASELLRRMEDRIGPIFNPEERLMARTYALVHDITHVAFGHTLEDELGLFVRHDRNSPRIERLLFSNKSRLGELLRSTDFGRSVLVHFESESSTPKTSWLTDLIEAPSGADTIDYIDRDSTYCGLDHKVDTAIFRRFTIDNSNMFHRDERHILTQVWGKKGLRLDAEFALESLLRERYALFLKVYTHPSKISAGAMLGKAIRELHNQKKRSLVLDERQLEWMSDAELLLFLKSSQISHVSALAKQFLMREIFRPAFRARALDPTQCNYDQYSARQNSLAQLGLFDTRKLSALEAELAKKSGLKSQEVILYCPRNAPGLQKVRQYIETNPGASTLRDEVFGPHFRMALEHMRLWEIYVFAPPEISSDSRAQLAHAASDLLHLKNEVEIDRRQPMDGRQLALPLDSR